MDSELLNEQPVESASLAVNAVPADFPRPVHLAAVSGAQPKLLLTKYQGRFYTPGGTPPQLLERWKSCEDLAQQLSVKSLECKAGKRAHMTEVEILEQYLVRLIATGWTSKAEATWVIRRTAKLLNWQAPLDASH